jgi:hypothetical protein
MQLVEHHFPEILHTMGESSAPLYLCCQNFIDKVSHSILLFACSLP